MSTRIVMRCFRSTEDEADDPDAPIIDQVIRTGSLDRAVAVEDAADLQSTYQGYYSFIMQEEP